MLSILKYLHRFIDVSVFFSVKLQHNYLWGVLTKTFASLSRGCGLIPSNNTAVYNQESKTVNCLCSLGGRNGILRLSCQSQWHEPIISMCRFPLYKERFVKQLHKSYRSHTGWWLHIIQDYSRDKIKEGWIPFNRNRGLNLIYKSLWNSHYYWNHYFNLTLWF